MANWMMTGLIAWLFLIGLCSAIEHRWALMVYGFGGTIINIAVMVGMK